MPSCRAPGRRDREADRWRRLSRDTAAMPRPVGILDVGVGCGDPQVAALGENLCSQLTPWETDVHTGTDEKRMVWEWRPRYSSVFSPHARLVAAVWYPCSGLPPGGERSRSTEPGYQRDQERLQGCQVRNTDGGTWLRASYLSSRSQSGPGWELALMGGNIPSVLRPLPVLGLLGFSLVLGK